ncbi:MAG: hypothetical protein SGPRY_010740 [Prymnesium sp.]
MSSHPPPQARDTQVSWLKMMKKREEQRKLLLARHTKELRLAFGGWMGVSREARVCRLLAIRDEHVACLSSRLQQVQQLVGLSAISSSPGAPAKSSPSESPACASNLEHACVRLKRCERLTLVDSTRENADEARSLIPSVIARSRRGEGRGEGRGCEPTACAHVSPAGLYERGLKQRAKREAAMARRRREGEGELRSFAVGESHLSRRDRRSAESITHHFAHWERPCNTHRKPESWEERETRDHPERFIRRVEIRSEASPTLVPAPACVDPHPRGASPSPVAATFTTLMSALPKALDTYRERRYSRRASSPTRPVPVSQSAVASYPIVPKAEESDVLVDDQISL